MKKRIQYTVFQIQNEIKGAEWQWCYSAKQLEQELQAVFSGKILKAVFVSLRGYIESCHHDKDHIDLSFESGACRVLFENALLQLGIHAEGQFIYRIVPLQYVKMKDTIDHPPTEYNDIVDCFFSIDHHDLSVTVAEHRIDVIKVKRTDLWGIRIDGFDRQKANSAARRMDLPAEIDLYSDSYLLRLIGDDMEYYRVIVEKKIDNYSWE